MNSIRKAVIPVAGMGTRLLPATKSIPKELFPLGNIPGIHYIVEEAVSAGMTEILFVTSGRKKAIKDYFSEDSELAQWLENGQQTERLERIETLRSKAQFHYVDQTRLDGLGDAIYHAKSFVNGQPFGVLLGDAVMLAAKPVMMQMVEAMPPGGGMMVGAAEVAPNEVSRYGIIEGSPITDTLYGMDSLIEKPSMTDTASRLAISGRYILPPDIFDFLEKTVPGVGNEIQLTDAINAALVRHQGYAFQFEGNRYDIGKKISYLLANLMFAMEDDEARPVLMEKMQAILKTPLPR